MAENKISFLLIHGFTGTHFEMEPLEKFLVARGYNVKNITLPGHETTPKDMANTKWEKWIEFTQNELDHLKQTSEKVFVAGLSMGGIITLILGSRNKNLSGIITMAAPYKSPDWRMHLFKIIPFIEKIYPMHKSEEKGWEDLEALATHKCYGFYPSASIKQLYDLLKQVKISIPQIELPILILQGKKDKGIPESHPKWIFKNVKSTDKQLEWIEKGGHVIPKDAGKEQAFKIIEDWVKQRI